MPWSTNVAVQLQAGETIINPSGIFSYSPVPAAGNLFFSAAPVAGTDSFGNSYLSLLNAYTSVASGPAAGSYALQLGQVSVLGTPAPGLFIHNTGSAPTIDPSFVAISATTGCEAVLGSGQSTAGATESAVVAQDSVLSGHASGLVVINGDGSVTGNFVITGTLSVNGSTNTGTSGLTDGTINGTSSTAGLANGQISGTSGPASAGTAHTHSPGSFAVTSGLHSHGNGSYAVANGTHLHAL